MRIVTRFAPSPTGALHIGGARTAIFSWLFAKKHTDGKFLLRIEDSDPKRSFPKALDSILDALSWLGLQWDAPPLYQSQRFEIYRTLLQQWLQQKKAYFCECSKERLVALRSEKLRNGELPKYDGCCRDKEIKGDLRQGVVRFKSPQEGISTFKDMTRGEIKIEKSRLDDLVLWRQAAPTYNFCVVIDDFLSEVTHIIRGDDHISNTHRQIALIQALEAPIPCYAHLPMVLDEHGEKLSKRTGAKSLKEYEAMGILPAAMLNYIARLGASFGERGELEILTVEQLIAYFDLKRIQRAPARLDFKKLKWVNAQHMQRSSTQELLCRLKENFSPFLSSLFLNQHEPFLERAINLYKYRVDTLQDLSQSLEACWRPPAWFTDREEIPGTLKEGKAALRLLKDSSKKLSKWNPEELRVLLKEIAHQMNWDFKRFALWVRWVLLEKKSSLNLSQLLFLLGKEESLKRFETFLAI